MHGDFASLAFGNQTFGFSRCDCDTNGGGVIGTRSGGVAEIVGLAGGRGTGIVGVLRGGKDPLGSVGGRVADGTAGWERGQEGQEEEPDVVGHGVTV